MKTGHLCAISIIMIMLTFLYINIDKAVNTETFSFHSIVFETRVSLISFDGIPGQSTSTLNASVDPALGRICAQFLCIFEEWPPFLSKPVS